MEIIPAIDIIDGKCVRLTQGDYSQKKIYNESPLEVARQFQDIGLKRLHLVDLDGAKQGSLVNYKVLETIASRTNLIIDFGGGLKTDESLRIIFECGAALAAIGSTAVKDKELFFSWICRYGADRILLGADVREEMICISGWLESTEINVFEFIRENMEQGVKTVFCTDIAKDGLLQGSSVQLYEKITAQFPAVSLIASGGVSSLRDLDDLKAAGCNGAIVGKAIYESKISLSDLEKYILC